MSTTGGGAAPAAAQATVTPPRLELGRFPEAADAADAAAPQAAALTPAAVGVLVPSDDGVPALPDTTTLAHLLGVALANPGALLDADACAQRGFGARRGQTLVLTWAPHAPTVVLVGVGERGSLDGEALRRAGAAFVRAGGRGGSGVLHLDPDIVAGAGVGTGVGTDALARAVQAVAEGAGLAAYAYDRHRTRPRRGSDERGRTLDRVLLVVEGDGTRIEGALRRAATIVDAVCFARDLVNEPPSEMTPTRLAAAAAQRLGGLAGLSVDVWDEGRIRAESLGALLGVARGSEEPPRLVRATWDPPAPAAPPAGADSDEPAESARPHLVVVGKGITFDSGGLSLKTAEGMTTMKTDMSGAAVVLATVWAAARLELPVKVTAIAPVTENMPGGGAIKPGDVLRTRGGQTIEVLNTDAEGRLVLADALTLAGELRPDAIVDVATLTGACTVALGKGIGGLFASDDGLAAALLSASDRTGEALWRLPLAAQYEEHIDSEVADMKNTGRPGQAGAIVAALLLGRFVGDVPWAHLDIAGPARSDEDAGYVAKGGTAFGVRTLVELLSAWPPPPRS